MCFERRYGVFGSSESVKLNRFSLGSQLLHFVIDICEIVTDIRRLCARFEVTKNYGMVHIYSCINCILLFQTLTVYVFLLGIFYKEEMLLFSD